MADVTLPALGESVTEGIITQWLVAVGDTVEVDQPLVEISTDKVDTEIPSPVAGVVQSLNGAVDDTIEIGHVIAVIGGEGAAPAAPAPEAAAPPAPAPAAAPAPAPAAAPAAPAPAAAAAPAPAVSDGVGVLTSPLVRKLLREAGVDVTSVAGSGPGGRITRADAEAAVANPPAAAAAPASASAPAQASTMTAPPAFTSGAADVTRPGPGSKQFNFGGERQLTEPLSRVRKAIAGGMKHSLDTSAQLTAVVEVDMTRVMNLR
ncbi:MAG: pyruvate dehydrogenase E2 component (dihydrolipoamide acetyltransferase), partial [Nitriliruptoraceae bacterium]